MQTLQVNNSRILGIKNAKFSGYHFYLKTNIWVDFKICISVPLWLYSGEDTMVCIVKVRLYKSIIQESSRQIIQICLKFKLLCLRKKFSLALIFLRTLQVTDSPSRLESRCKRDILQYCAILGSNLHMICLVLVGFSFERKKLFLLYHP